MAAADLEAEIRARALALGFDVVRFGPARLGAEVGARLDAFIADGGAGDMDWLARDPGKRSSPDRLWPEARSSILLGVNYGTEEDPLALADRPDRGIISVYARGDDYHDVVKKRLKVLGRWLAEESGAPLKVFVDTAPILEKPLAQAGGVGWQGKHTNLVSRDFGSWLFLAEILTSLELTADEPETDHCGACTRCLEACPTAAFPAPYRLDARRCLSYLTIEHRGPIPHEFRAAMANRIYGCDDCLAVCPWNKFASASREIAFAPREALTAPHLAELAALDDAGFRALFRHSPIKRIGLARFLRNVLIALGNSGEPALAAVVEARLGDPSPLVRGAALWALHRLAPERLDGPDGEADETVLEEWRRIRAPEHHR